MNRSIEAHYRDDTRKTSTSRTSLPARESPNASFSRSPRTGFNTVPYNRCRCANSAGTGHSSVDVYPSRAGITSLRLPPRRMAGIPPSCPSPTSPTSRPRMQLVVPTVRRTGSFAHHR